MENFKNFLAKLLEGLYNQGWYSQSFYVLKCKDIEECRKYVEEHCGKEYLFLIDGIK